MALDRTKVLESAQKHLAKGHYERAIVEYQKLVAADPRDVRTWLKIGDLHTRQGDHEKACETYGRVADQYTQQGFFRKAVAVYKQILKLDPERLDVLLALGDMYEQLQLASDALMTFESVANEYIKRGDTVAALDTLARMVSLDSDNIPIRIKYAEALSKAGRTEDAADSFEVGAQLLEDLGRHDDYIKVAERLLYHRPEDHELAEKLARLYLERDDPKRALSKLQICFQADPCNVDTLHLLARSFEALGQLPKTVSVYKEIARLHQQAGRVEERAVILKEILELDPGDTETRRALASFAPPSSVLPVTPSAPPPGAIVEQPSVAPIDDEPSFQILEDDDSAIFLTDDDNVELRDQVEELEELPSTEFDAIADPSGLLILEDEDEDEDTGQRSISPQAVLAPAGEDAWAEADPFPSTSELPPGAVIDSLAPPMTGGRGEIAGADQLAAEQEGTGDAVLEILVDDVQTGSVPSISLGADGPSTGTSEIPSIPPDVAREAQIARLLTECDVFHRYGLQAKVIQQLGRVLEIAPDHVEARERLKDAHVEAGNIDQAVFHLYELASMFREDRPNVAVLYYRQVLELDPASEPARAEADAYHSELPPAGFVPVAPEEAVHVVDAPSEGPTYPAQNIADVVPSGEFFEDDEDLEIPPGSRRRTQTNLGWPSRNAPPPPEGAAAPLPVTEAAQERTSASSNWADSQAPTSELQPSLPDQTVHQTAPEAPHENIPATGAPEESISPPPPAPPEPAAWKPPPPAALLSPRVPPRNPVQPRKAGPAGLRPLRAKEPAAPVPSPKVALAPSPVASNPVAAPTEKEPVAIAPPAGAAAGADKPASADKPALGENEVEEIIGEADFFAAQGLLEEARTTLQDILKRHQEHPAIMGRLAELAELAAAQEIASAPPMSGEDEAFQLAEKLAEELDEDSSPTDAGAEMIDVETVFAQFKRGVKEQIGPQDSDTHFDLGIAYKEMGLLDDAIEEFELAKNSASKECIALTMIGLCHVEKGTLNDAVDSFKKGLHADAMTPREELGLYFELGIAYELLKDPTEAIYYYEKVRKRDASFRGVEERIAELRQDPKASQTRAASRGVDQELDELLDSKK